VSRNWSMSAHHLQVRLSKGVLVLCHCEPFLGVCEHLLCGLQGGLKRVQTGLVDRRVTGVGSLHYTYAHTHTHTFSSGTHITYTCTHDL
jgi:hypothetical protein